MKNRWAFPPVTEKMKEGVNKEVEYEKKKSTKDEPRIIQLGLMNGEVIKIHIEEIECLQIFNISENHYVTSDFPFLERCKFCERAFIKLNKETADMKYDLKKGITIYERLTQSNDISDITYLNAYGRMLDRILVPWSDMSNDGMENGHQFSRMDRQGNLEIIIKGD